MEKKRISDFCGSYWFESLLEHLWKIILPTEISFLFVTWIFFGLGGLNRYRKNCLGIPKWFLLIELLQRWSNMCSRTVLDFDMILCEGFWKNRGRFVSPKLHHYLRLGTIVSFGFRYRAHNKGWEIFFKKSPPSWKYFFKISSFLKIIFLSIALRADAFNRSHASITK